MDETTKKAIKKTILALRKLLEKEDIPAVLRQYGIFPDGRRVPVEKLALLDDNGKKRRGRLEAIIEREIHAAGGEQKAGVQRYCREVAFTYLNRLVALRCIEVRRLIDESIKVRDDYAGRSLRHNRFLKEKPGIQFDHEDTDGLKAFLYFIFKELYDDIKILFDPDDEYSIVMPSIQALRECIRSLNEEIPEEAFKEPELIGWVYQYFQTEEKDRVFEEVRTKKKKIEGDDIVPATSLYTERYMVDYLVQNSLGTIWMEMYPVRNGDSNGVHPDSKPCSARSESISENWPYFVKDQDLKTRAPRPVKSITFLDPACGGGHFLLVAFDLFVQMYEEEWKMYGGRLVVPTDIKENVSKFSIRRRHLPHWELPGAVYFITVTLKNRDDIDLTQDSIGPKIVNAFLFYDRKRYYLYEYTVMPDHFHIIIQPIEKEGKTEPLHNILKDIKSYTAHEINKVFSRSGHVWLDESYDRIIRDEKEYEEKRNYIYENPLRKGLIDSPGKWPWFGRGSSGMGEMSDGDVRPTTERLKECPFSKEDLVPPEKIPTTILESNLHGIDIDLRSVQLTYLVLYLRMREHQRSVGAPACAEASAGRPKSLPIKVNLVAADASLLNTPEFLSWCEERFKEEPYAFNITKGIVGRLRNLSEIGSLAQPEEDLKELIHKEKERLLSAWKKVKVPQQKTFSPELLKPEQRELPFGKITDDQFWEGVLSQVTKALDEYYREASERGDTRAQVLAHEASRGFKFLELCHKRYDVVATNPPYMGSKNMGRELKDYVQKVFPEGKRDLYTAFIQRNCEWTSESGIVAMVTQQSWMFLRSFVEMREQILKGSSIQTLAHLGPRAFAEISGEVVNAVLFTLANEMPVEEHRLVAFRAVLQESASEKSVFLMRLIRFTQLQNKFILKQAYISRTSTCSLAYWLQDKFFNLMAHPYTLKKVANVKRAIDPSDINKFVRYRWEIDRVSTRWIDFSYGGGYSKWTGFNYHCVDWLDNGDLLKNDPRSAVSNEHLYYLEGLTYTDFARGKLGVRFLSRDEFFSGNAPGIFTYGISLMSLLAILNCRLHTYLLRAMSPQIQHLRAVYIESLPMLPLSKVKEKLYGDLALCCVNLKSAVLSIFPVEVRHFSSSILNQRGSSLLSLHGRYCYQQSLTSSILNALEGYAEIQVFADYGVSGQDMAEVIQDLGTPAGWHPLIEGYDAIPKTDICEIPEEVVEHLKKRERINPPGEELARIKSRLRALYEAGPGAKVEDVVEEESDSDDEEEAESLISKRIPIPTETFLEELSVKMEIHPISIYWLLKEMWEKEGLICWPECKRYAEDYFTVMILRMLGFCWPKQIEANEPIPDWADKDGIIPITEHTEEKTLLERIRDRIGVEFSEDRISDIESEFADILYNAASKEAEIRGRTPPKKKVTLAQWLEKEFFKRHTSQFKKRPIAWHLTSSNGTFQVLMFCHKISLDMFKNLKNRHLAKVQSYYGSLLERARCRLDVPSDNRLSVETTDLRDIEIELEEFSNKLDKLIAMPYEPLIDDGVRVNIAPLQKLGLLALASPVLATKDVDRAIADRNRWREDDKEQTTVWRI